MYKTLLARRQELKDSQEGGFTLIELLVVVVIIGILVAIAIPLYLHFENGAKASGAEADVHGLTSLVKLCQSDNGGTLPAGVSSTKQSFVFGEKACANDTYNLSTNDTAVYSGDLTSATPSNPGNWTVTVTNSDSGKAYIYKSTDGTTTLVPSA